MTDRHTVLAPGLSATVTAAGGELIGLRDPEGRELLWQAGPEWPRHAPLLFPVVGRLKDDTLRHRGKAYSLGQHGFARDCRFRWTERSEGRASLRLTESPQTLARYPFPFVLEMIYEADGGTLSVTTRVTNTGSEALPCGVGAHPGFRWPLVDGVPKEAHVVVFESRETGQALSVRDSLLADPKPLPFDGTTLPLAESLFERDALVMPAVGSRSVRYAARGPDGQEIRAITVGWEGYKDLGIWAKPGGAAFVCIEPWFSMASPVDWDGEFAEKPGILIVPPGASRDFVWRVTL
ncbi:aldose 1-epimerase family protein [Lutibaculum baratangense]|uniref:LacX protein, plasmid n=1 Tax=Lutibaculum baratangense AMV1 TaxID=631454 RepID=V4RAI4_9HYPH|nr:aldose 1-epimerase family protein [Lutibaculum baratangense]ESR23191.1 LacX protein, plasmid [Lutibaculum baratangense AMV1]